MPGTFVTSEGTTTIKLEYSAPTAVVLDVITDAANYLWKEETDEDGVVTNPFSEATNQDKIDIVAAQVKQEIIDKANTFKSNAAQTVARETEAADEHTL